MIHRLASVTLLFAVVLIMALAAIGVHEIAIHSQPCYGTIWPVSQCKMAR